MEDNSMDHCCLEELAGSKHEQAVPKGPVLCARGPF